MASEQEKPQQPNGPCLMGQEHTFQVVSTTDPFSGDQIITIVCTGCGTTR